jgi:arsenite methyltransferase
VTNHAEGEIRGAVRDRYARAATEEATCRGSSCCGGNDLSEVGRSLGYSEQELAMLPDGANLGLGCGNPTAIASLQEGETVLDLGSGAGIDCFLAAQRVGPGGRVIGVDMTPQMIERARESAVAGGYANVEFRLGQIEALPVADATVDIVISNCVLNLSTDRAKALGEAHRVLRPGGRIVVSDMVSERAVPESVQGSLDAVAACLPTSRERYLAEFRAAGFIDVRISDEKPYPASYILGDPGVLEFLEAHAESRDEMEAFAASIFGGVFVGTKR